MIDTNRLNHITVTGPLLSLDSNEFIFTVHLSQNFIRVYVDYAKFKSGDFAELERELGKAVTTLLLANQ